MKISELPKKIKEKALEYQRYEKNKSFDKNTDYLIMAFYWHNTFEGSDYWCDWSKKEPMKPEFEGTIEGFKPKQIENNNGGKTDYYDLPEKAISIQDLIEHREMNFSIGNIFKACYRFGKQSHSNEIRDLNKIIYFANRQLDILNKKQLNGKTISSSEDK